MKRATIHDVAKQAGVSLATVDRALNNRPGVRPKTLEKVRQAVEHLNYQPDVFAAALATKRLYRFHFLLPNAPNGFMETLRQEAQNARETASADRVQLHIELIDAFDSHRVTGTLAILDRTVCDGVAVVAPAFPEVRAAIDRLQDRGVHVVTLVSDHPSSNRAHFVGIDNVAAGRTAGRLFGRFLSRKPGTIAVIAGSLGLRDHADRFAGCEEVLRESFSHLQLLKVREGRDNNQRNEALVQALLAQHSDLAGIYNVGAGNLGISNALSSVEAQKKPLFIGHELTQNTKKALRAGLMDAVIAQDPGLEIRSTLRVLRALCDNRSVEEAKEQIGIGVYLEDNLPN